MTLKGDFVESQLLGWIEVVLETITCLVVTILMIIYIKYFCNKNKKNMDGRFHWILFGSLVTTVIFTYVHYILNTVIVLILGLKPKNFCFISTISYTPIFIQRIHVYIFFIVRLYMTFKGSVMEISRIKTKIIVILVCISIISLRIYTSIISYFNKTEFFCNDGDLAHLFLINVLGMLVVDTFWQILLSVLYIAKLRGLIKMITSNNDKKDNKLFNIVNKLTILAIVTVVSSVLVIVIHVYISSWSSAMIPTELIVNNICVMLSFAVFEKSYKRCCCGCIKIHNKCCGIHDDDTVELVKAIEVSNPSKTPT